MASKPATTQTSASAWYQDRRSGEPLRVRTIAGFAPLIPGGADTRRERLLDLLHSQTFAGHDGFRWPLPPSTSPEEPRFHPRACWRSPVWPVVSWLFWRSMKLAGEEERAEALRRSSLESSPPAASRSTSSRSPASRWARTTSPGPPPSPSTGLPGRPSHRPRENAPAFRPGRRNLLLCGTYPTLWESSSTNVIARLTL